MRDLTSKVFPLTRRYPAPPKRPKKRRLGASGNGSKKSQSSSYQTSSQRVLQRQCELITAVVVDEHYSGLRSLGTQTARRLLPPHRWTSLRPPRRWSLLAVGTVSDDVDVEVPSRHKPNLPRQKKKRTIKNGSLVVSPCSSSSSSLTSTLHVLPVSCSTVSCPQLDSVS